MHGVRILIAPMAFKGTLSARRAAAAIARGACAASRARADCTLSWDLAPMADGGDGSIDALVGAGWQRHVVTTTGALGEPGPASIAQHDSTVAVEIANSCGIARLGSTPLRPLDASSRGLGEAIASALALSPRTLIVFLGGSASTDGGIGMLVALGARLLDAHGRKVLGFAELDRVARVDLGPVRDAFAGVDIRVATDVSNPLLGPHGAAAVFGPQKGASPEQVSELEQRMHMWSRVLSESLDATDVPDAAQRPGAGAAGGSAFPLLALGATRVSGAHVIAEELRIDDRIRTSDVVITGEGAFDAQSLMGKGAVDVVHRAALLGVPVGVIAGQAALEATDAAGDLAFIRSLVDAPIDSREHPARALEAAAHDAVSEWLARPTPQP